MTELATVGKRQVFTCFFFSSLFVSQSVWAIGYTVVCMVVGGDRCGHQSMFLSFFPFFGGSILIAVYTSNYESKRVVCDCALTIGLKSF